MVVGENAAKWPRKSDPPSDVIDPQADLTSRVRVTNSLTSGIGSATCYYNHSHSECKSRCHQLLAFNKKTHQWIPPLGSRSGHPVLSLPVQQRQSVSGVKTTQQENQASDSLKDANPTVPAVPASRVLRAANPYPNAVKQCIASLRLNSRTHDLSPWRKGTGTG